MSITYNRQSSISSRNTCSMVTTKGEPVKQLQEILQQQQEPFILEVYLLERGCLGKKLNSKSNCRSHGNAKKFLKRSVSHLQNRKGTPHCSRVLQAMYNWVISTNGSTRNKSSNPKDQNSCVIWGCNDNQQAASLDKFSSASRITAFNSCSDSEVEKSSTLLPKEARLYMQQAHPYLSNSVIHQKERNHREFSCSWSKQADTVRKFQQQSVEDRKPVISISFLDNLSSHGNYPLHTDETDDFVLMEENPLKARVKVREDPILSASLWKTLLQTATEKPICEDVTEIQELIQSHISSDYLISKTVLQQTKQLLFDCLREIVQTQIKKRKQQQQSKEYLGVEELGKLIGEKIESLGKQSGGKSNLTKLLDLDLQDSAQEWRMYETQRWNIALEIGDSILEEIKNETVMEIIFLLISY